jgi:hypothetical protein
MGLLDGQLAAYCLNFNGRVTKPSVKNFQVSSHQSKDALYFHVVVSVTIPVFHVK